MALDITHHEHFMVSFQRTLWWFVVIATVSASALGWLVVRRGLAPLHAIHHGAAAVTATRLDFRSALESIPVELAELADTLNQMFARLEDSFQRLKPAHPALPYAMGPGCVRCDANASLRGAPPRRARPGR